MRCPRPGENQQARFSLGFFNQARREAVIQGPAKLYPKITGGEFLAQAMKVRYAASLSSHSRQRDADEARIFSQRNYDAAMKKNQLETYEVKAETLEANKNYQVSGTGLERAKVPTAVAAA